MEKWILDQFLRFRSPNNANVYNISVPPTIHLLTDFGTSAEFIGVMKGAGMQWLDTVTQWKILKISW